MTVSFTPYNFEPGNMFYVGISEELVEAQVNDAIDYIRAKYGQILTVEQLEQAFVDFDIDYPVLPNWLQKKFDEFDVI